MASILSLLGQCGELRGRFLTALNYYQDCLKIREEQRSECQENDYNCEIATVLLRTESLGKACSYDSSYLLSLIEKALETEEIVHGRGSNHNHLAICFSRLGYRLMQESSGTQGLEYLKKAIKMFQEMNSDHTNDYGEIQVTAGIALRDVSPNEAEKHFRIAETVFKMNLKGDNHMVFLQINSSLLQIFMQTNRVEDGLELAKLQKGLIDSMLSESSSPNLRLFYQVSWLSLFYEASGQRKTARKLYIDLIRRIEQQIDPKDPENDNFMFLLWLCEEAAGESYQCDEMFSEAEAMFQRYFESTQTTSSHKPFVKTARIIARWQLASIFVETGRDSQACDLLNDLIKMHEKVQESIDVIVVSSAFLLRGELNRRRGRWNSSLQDLENALRLTKEFRTTVTAGIMSKKAKQTYAKIMNTIGLVYEQTGNPKRALHYYQCSLNSVKGMCCTKDTASFYQNAADASKTLGRLNDALIYYSKSLEIREMLHSEDPVREDIATVLYHIALTQFINKRPKEASETLEKLLPLRQKLLTEGGSLQNYCAVLVLKGNCHIIEPSQAQQAKDAYEEAEKVLKRMTEGQPSLDYATVVSNIGCASKLLGELEKAIPKLQDALELKRIIYQERKEEPVVAQACRLLADALFQNKEYEKAFSYFQEALEIYEVHQSAEDEAECLLYITLCNKALKKIDFAKSSLKKLEELCASKSLKDEMLLHIHKEMADIFFEEEYEERSKGLYHLKQAEAILIRVKQSDEEEETLTELQAKIMSLEFS